MRENMPFFNEDAYRVSVALTACAESGLTETLITDIVRMVNVSYGSVYRWIGIFETCGCVCTTRYKNRKNIDGVFNRHVIIHLTNKKTLERLYKCIHTEDWEARLEEELNAESPNLKLVKKAA